MAKILHSVKEKLKEAQCRVTESVRIAEDSLVEKDAALLREKHALSKPVSHTVDVTGVKADFPLMNPSLTYSYMAQMRCIGWRGL